MNMNERQIFNLKRKFTIFDYILIILIFISLIESFFLFTKYENILPFFCCLAIFVGEMNSLFMGFKNGYIGVPVEIITAKTKVFKISDKNVCKYFLASSEFEAHLWSHLQNFSDDAVIEQHCEVTFFN